MLKILNSMLYAALTSSKLRIAHVLLQIEAHEVGRPDNAFDEVTDTRTIVIFKWQFSVSVLVVLFEHYQCSIYRFLASQITHEYQYYVTVLNKLLKHILVLLVLICLFNNACSIGSAGCTAIKGLNHGLERIAVQPYQREIQILSYHYTSRDINLLRLLGDILDILTAFCYLMS